MILGTAITCSETGHSVSKKRRTSTSCSPICRTGASRIRTNLQVASACSTVCCSTRSCGQQQVRPHPARLLNEVEEHRLGKKNSRPERVCVVHLTLLLPGPCLLLALCAVVLTLGKGHLDAHLCIPQVCTEASLSSPPRGTRRVCSSFSRPHEVSQKSRAKKGKLSSGNCLYVVVVEWLYYSQRIIIVGWADLSGIVFSFIFVCKMCVLFHVQ